MEWPEGSQGQLAPLLVSQATPGSLKKLKFLVILEAMLLKAMAMRILKVNLVERPPTLFAHLSSVAGNPLGSAPRLRSSGDFYLS